VENKAEESRFCTHSHNEYSSSISSNILLHTLKVMLLVFFREEKSMKKRSLIIILLALSVVGFTSIDAKATFTVATFDDPSLGSSNPLFEVNFIGMTLNGGWANGKTGLTLEMGIPYGSHTFANAWFEMTEVKITNALALGDTGNGEINFYDGISTNPLLTISFESGYVDSFNFGADEIFVANNVTITGSEITGTLSEEQFAFSFANLAKLPGHSSWDDGFTATAAFNSSAVPEPATVALLGLGALSIVSRKKRV
jgi:hypothetical protein